MGATPLARMIGTACALLVLGREKPAPLREAVVEKMWWWECERLQISAYCKYPALYLKTDNHSSQKSEKHVISDRWCKNFLRWPPFQPLQLVLTLTTTPSEYFMVKRKTDENTVRVFPLQILF